MSRAGNTPAARLICDETTAKRLADQLSGHFELSESAVAAFAGVDGRWHVEIHFPAPPDEAAVRQKFGVSPASIPDWLALVGDSADGYPGLPGWGARSAATVLARYQHLEHIPESATRWDVSVRGAARLAATLAEQRERALLFRTLATLRTDAPIGVDVDALRWTGPRADFGAWSVRLGTPALHERASTLAAARAVSIPGH